jgi:hypothetical protein
VAGFGWVNKQIASLLFVVSIADSRQAGGPKKSAMLKQNKQTNKKQTTAHRRAPEKNLGHVGETRSEIHRSPHH